VWEGIVSDEELVRFFNRSRISLGFSSCGNTYRDAKRIVQIRLRDFEVPMSGGFYLVEYMPELEQFFRIGREIVCYHDRHDLLDKVRFYLAHDRERERIRWAGCERARRDHTWQRRLSAAFSEMGLR
jgi:spore maturation protein CgeB